MVPSRSRVLAEAQLELYFTKTAKLGLLSLPSLVFNKKFTKSKLVRLCKFSPPGKQTRTLRLYSAVL